MPTYNEAMVALGRLWSEIAQRSDRSEMADLLTDDFVMWYNFTNSERGKADFIETLHAARKVFPAQVNAEERVLATENGFVLQATLTGDMMGKHVSAPYCLVCRVRDGKIYRADEYFDTAQLPMSASNDGTELVMKQ